MNINATAPSYQLPHTDHFKGGDRAQLNNWSGSGRNQQVSSTLVSEMYSRDSLSIEYTSKDGDTVSLNVEQINYQKTMIQQSGSGAEAIFSEDWNKIVEDITKAFLEMKSEATRKLLDGIDGKIDDTGTKASSTGAVEAAAVPEYWNAENTSQRIVDFATSFYDVAQTNGFGDEFIEMIKGAIDEGFSMAKDMMGVLPDATAKLVNDTYDLVMQKMDSWWEGIQQTDQNSETAPEAAVVV